MRMEWTVVVAGVVMGEGEGGEGEVFWKKLPGYS